ncbi:hypothetical protein G159_00940 [Planococcus glaciei CHR43]|nr:hypothetical protein G159_00940 [Planococcus glaciei CHR43]
METAFVWVDLFLLYKQQRGITAADIPHGFQFPAVRDRILHAAGANRLKSVVELILFIKNFV